MNKSFDIGLEQLTGTAGISIGNSVSTKYAGDGAEAAVPDRLRGTFFLETFGCQMNDTIRRKSRAFCCRAATDKWSRRSLPR